MKAYQNLIPKNATPFLIIFGVLTAASVLGVVYTHQLPLYETRSTTIATYTQTERYSYRAKLKPNTFYNKQILRPGEGLLYTAIVEHINMTSHYSFNSSPSPNDATTDIRIAIELESPEKWTRTLTDNETRWLLNLEGSPDFSLTINHTKIHEFVTHIDEEVGIRSTTYNLNVNPVIHTSATLGTRKIEETFTPTLTISFITGGDKGNHISIENLYQTKPGQITETSRNHLQWVEEQRRTAYASTFITAIFLTGSAYLYLRQRPKAPARKPIEKIVAPYREFITETIQEPPEATTTINLATLEDLAKTAEILARPIMHSKHNDEHTFYVIDNEKKYQYEIKAA